MASLRKFLIISLCCHLVLILAMVEVHWSGKRIDPSSTYEVSIVAGVPSGGKGSPGSAAPRGKRYVNTGPRKAASIGEVRKEHGGRDRAPELSASDIRPEAPDEAQDVPEGADIAKGRAAGGGTGPAQGPAGGAATEIAVWKTRVRSMVEMLWRTPPEIEIMDTGLKTTYLLRVGRGGELLSKRLLVSSGNVPFDRSILVALGRVSRFPSPPLALIAGEDWVEVTISFTPSRGAQ